MPISYDTLGAQVTIEPSGTVAPADLNTSVAIVGGYDAANGSATAGESTTILGLSDADEQFGSNSELARATAAAITNGASTVYGVPVPETQTTETFTSSTSGTLGNTPAFDPRVQPEHEITAQDSVDGITVTVNEVYGTPTTPSNTNTINVNPVTGEWAADSSSDYDITYTYGDYTSAIQTAVDQPVRYVLVGTENDSVKLTLNQELNEAERNFRLLRGVVGATPDIQSGEVSDYTPVEQDWRMIEVAPARGTGADGTLRTCFAVGGLMAGQPVDVTGSITYDQVNGFSDLNVNYAPTTAAAFEQVTALTDEFDVAEGITTSSELSFRDIYKVEIVDLITERLYQRIKNYRGGSNARTAQLRFQSRLKRDLGSFASAQPPLLADGEGGVPFTVTVSTGTVDTEADVDVGIDVAPIAKQVKLNVSVGPIEFGGAEV